MQAAMSLPSLPPLLRAGTFAVATFLAALVIGTLFLDRVLLGPVVAADADLDTAPTVVQGLLFLIVAGAAGLAVVAGVVLAIRFGARDRSRALLAMAGAVAVTNALLTPTEAGRGGVVRTLLAIVIPAAAAFAAGVFTSRRV